MQMKVRVRDLNEHVVCGLCKGYLVSATLVTECLHACKTYVAVTFSWGHGHSDTNTSVSRYLRIKPHAFLVDSRDRSTSPRRCFFYSRDRSTSPRRCFLYSYMNLHIILMIPLRHAHSLATQT